MTDSAGPHFPGARPATANRPARQPGGSVRGYPRAVCFAPMTHSDSPKNPPPSMWPAVLLVVAVLAGVVVMSALRIPTDDLLQLVPLLVLPLLAYLIGQVNQVKHQTNGNVSALMEQLKSAQEALARSVPADTAPAPASAPPAPGETPWGRAAVAPPGTYDPPPWSGAFGSGGE